MNGLAQNRWQAIIRTNVDLLSAELFVIKLSDNKNHSSQENYFQKVICKTAAILPQPQGTHQNSLC